MKNTDETIQIPLATFKFYLIVDFWRKASHLLIYSLKIYNDNPVCIALWLKRQISNLPVFFFLIW